MIGAGSSVFRARPCRRHWPADAGRHRCVVFTANPFSLEPCCGAGARPRSTATRSMAITWPAFTSGSSLCTAAQHALIANARR